MGSTTAVTIPVQLQADRNRRGAERFFAAMPVTVDGRESTTNDFSATGLSFVADHPYEIGAHIDVVIEYLLDGHHYPLPCQAEVVRVEACSGGYNIGARLAAHSQLPEIPVPAEAPAAGQYAPLRPID
jgi:hypothetical protein